MPSIKKKKSRGEASDGVLVNKDPIEPTMGEKLASMNLNNFDDAQSHVEKQQPEPSLVTVAQPPSADSVQVLLRQALRADDHVLLLDCLYNRDEKVIAKSVSLLNPSDVLKLLQSLISIMQSRGAILACALPWLRSLLLQHASGIMSQESSLIALNSLYQVVDDDRDENATMVPVIYEDRDESDDEKSEDAMETDLDSTDEEASEAFDGVSDIDEVMA
ncbi:hypothetical protein RGQ29_020841 [Quercus rubra]|uniref:Small-subunit processome Utp12 domain-containing protein n=1 Tax=Quercus rubra TaxID=3512 RepID=A0AAN7IY14_QUERU|nr:hypothetical protein RGQ29_020841 [Quercus rubra]KAK4590441.1 hypothetical protein RGQ29_020841 [Quercus rubra]